MTRLSQRKTTTLLYECCATTRITTALMNKLPKPKTTKKPIGCESRRRAPQKTCAYGAQQAKRRIVGGTEAPASPLVSKLTGSSCRTETEHEARRTHTSEFGRKETARESCSARGKFSL